MRKNLELLISKIENQQKGKENSPAFQIGEQLKEIARVEEESAELLEQDIDKEGMSISDVAKKFQEYADEQHKKQKGSCVCISPQVAEKIIREFYGLPDRDEQSKAETESVPSFLDLGSFL